MRLRKLKQPVTLFGESDLERYQRLLSLGERTALGMKKSDKDETSKSFMPEEHDIELLKFMKQQEDMLKLEAKKLRELNQFEELKEEDEEGDV